MKELARKAHISYGALKIMETNQAVQFSLGINLSVAMALGVSLFDLFPHEKIRYEIYKSLDTGKP